MNLEIVGSSLKLDRGQRLKLDREFVMEVEKPPEIEVGSPLKFLWSGLMVGSWPVFTLEITPTPEID